MQKNYQKPEFQVVCQNLANAKFFAASDFAGPSPAASMTVSNAPTSTSTGGWF